MSEIAVLAPATMAPARFVEFVTRADELGFAQVWVAEDCFLGGGIAQAAVALGATQRISVGVGILPAAARNVAFAAMDVAFLANLHPDRLVVGVGHGMRGWLEQVGAWPESPLTLLGEYVTVLRALLAGERVTTSGRYVTLTDVVLEHPPARPPLVLAGVRGPRSLRLSGQVADGTILAEPSTPEYVAAARESIAALGEHVVVTYNVAAVDDDSARARELVRPDLWWAGDPAWAPHIDPLPFAADLRHLHATSRDAAHFVSRIPDEWVDQLAVVGTAERARTRVAEIRAAGADHVVLIPAGPDPVAMLTRLADVIA